MRNPINLYRQSRRRTKEVENINPRRMLTPEFEAARPLAQFAPEHCFGQRHFAPQLTGAFHHIARPGNHGLCPSTSFAGPPPRFGEEVSYIFG